MKKFENVDVIDTLQQIMRHNTAYYHVAGMDRCDCFNRSFLCPAVLPDVFFRLAGSE